MFTQPKSLATTLTSAFIVLSVTAVLIASSFQLVLNFWAQQEIVANAQKVVALSVAKEVSSVIRQILGILEATAQTGQPFTKTEAEQRTLLNGVLRLQPHFVEIALVDGAGREIQKVSRLKVLQQSDLRDLSETELFRQVRQNKPFIGSLHFDHVSQEPLITLAVPMLNPTFRFEGSLVAQVNVRFMWQFMAQMSQGAEIYMVDNQGRLLAFRDTSRILEDVSQLRNVTDFIQAQAGTEQIQSEIVTGIQGTTVLGVYVPLGQPNWAVMAEIPWQQAYQQVILNLVLLLTGAFVVATLAGGAGVYLARRFTAPLFHLTETASQIAAGQFDLVAPLETSAPLEVRRLASAFNSMTTQLRELIQSLEQRVFVRTQQLARVASLGENLNVILDFDTLTFEIGRQIKQNFDYYQTLIYLLDEPRQTLVLIEGGDEIATALKARNHAIPLTAKSLVARAARSGQIVVEANVHQTSDWLPNPYLPETQAEIAVPIILDKKVVGVLDVQQNQVGKLDESDVNTLRSLANQLAVALKNARLFTDLQISHQQLQNATEQLQSELLMARKIQQGLLAPAWPSHFGLEIGCYSVPAYQVGGDFYAYQNITSQQAQVGASGAQQYALAVGDISGKGMPAALLMGVSLALFHAMLDLATSPADLLNRLDHALAPYNRTTQQNCALCYVKLELHPKQGQAILYSSNAGCIPPLILRADKRVDWVNVKGIPLGVELGSQLGYVEQTVTLYTGDIVILCSDGIVEANATKGNMLGFDQFEQMVMAGPNHSVTALMAYLLAEVNQFMDHTELQDDLTLLMVRI